MAWDNRGRLAAPSLYILLLLLANAVLRGRAFTARGWRYSFSTMLFIARMNLYSACPTFWLPFLLG